jgi:effector-binding domain-containing protein
MTLQPSVEERPEQPYVSITSQVTMHQLGEVLPPLTPEVIEWADAAGLTITGPVFWKYNVIDMAAGLEVEVGVPVDRAVTGGGRMIGGVLPGGRYVVAHHVGHPDTLEAATAELLAWAEARQLSWDVAEVDGEERWAARLEEYLTNPDDQPDMSKWETNLVFRLAQ